MENKSLFSDYDDDDDVTMISEEVNYHTNEDIYMNYDTLKLKNYTSNVMTRYEKAKIIGLRSQQIAKGAKPLISTENLNNVMDIAIKELEEKKTPFILRRKVANKFEYWKIEDMIIN